MPPFRVAPGRVQDLVLLDDRYRLGPVIGRGGMAAVHAATDIRLRAEARLLAGLSHPGLPRVFDARA